jgi:hypothetical protein
LKILQKMCPRGGLKLGELWGRFRAGAVA